MILAARHKASVFYNDDDAIARDRIRTAKRIRDLRRDARTLARLFRKQGELLRDCVNARKALEQENNTLRNHLNPKA
jgi:hypothetical protein